jgi:transposase
VNLAIQRACYEAGPTGYDLYRLLASMKVRCDVVAPSLVPKGRGDRVKTDKRDSRRLAGLHRAGQLTPIAVPNPAQEAVRDLCRTRGDMVEDLTRARNRLTKFMLLHSMIYRDGTNWTIRHQQWLSGPHFEDPALAATFAHYRSTVQLRDTAPEAVEGGLQLTGTPSLAMAGLTTVAKSSMCRSLSSSGIPHTRL